jgi:hypothetical protein
MRNPSEWTEADLIDLIQNDVQEDLHLDYKQSAALARTDACRNELSKDVAAFANSDGGRIVYGIAEDRHHPDKIDECVDATQLKREWLEQVISSDVRPKIDDLKIYPIPLPSKGADRVSYVIDIPQSKSRAPHQSRDKRYYKRYNFQSVPMEDYEIRDIMRRATTPDLWIKFRFASGDSTRIDVQPGAGESEAFFLHAEIGNRSSTPAEYAMIDIYLDEFITPVNMAVMTLREKFTRNGREFNAYTTRWSIPNQLPIFAETMLAVTAPLMLSIASNLLPIGFDFYIGYAIRSPGCSVEEFVHVILQGRTLFIPKQGNG